MRRVRTLVMTGVLVGALAACSGSTEPDTTVTGTATDDQTVSEPTEGGDDPGGLHLCVGTELTEENVPVEFGPLAAASDEWSESLGVTWRHYFPTTVTNASDRPCTIGLTLDATVDGVDGEDDGARVDTYVALLPGQSAQLQALQVNRFADLSADAEDATPLETIEPFVSNRGALLYVPDYYETELSVEGVSGEGKDAVLTATVTVDAVTEGMPERAIGANQDTVTVQGLDANGDVITSAYQHIEPIEVGETRTLEFFVGGGDSSGQTWNDVPAAVYDDVVSWNLVMHPLHVAA